jgi:hypothetical protein
LQFVLSPTVATKRVIVGFSLLIIRAFVGKPYLLFLVRDYTYKITTKHHRREEDYYKTRKR